MKPEDVPDDLLTLAADAIRRYDWDTGLSANPDVSKHQRREAAAVLAAVLPVFEAETAALLRRAETGERSAAAWQADARLFDENSDYWRKRAEVAERERDDYHQRFANQMAAGSELVEKLQQAEAAVRRVRGVHNGGSAENAVLCVACCEVLPCPTLRALDAEQPKETP